MPRLAMFEGYMPVKVGEFNPTKDRYVLLTPDPSFGGKFMGVQFNDGKGVTKHKDKAFQMMERFGFTVILPKGEDARKWAPAQSHESYVVTEKERPEDGDIPLELYDALYPEDNEESETE